MTISIRSTEHSSKSDNFFADLFVTARKSAGYTLEQLAITTGLTTAEITAIENGKDTQSAKVARLASVLRISQDSFA